MFLLDASADALAHGAAHSVAPLALFTVSDNPISMAFVGKLMDKLALTPVSRFLPETACPQEPRAGQEDHLWKAGMPRHRRCEHSPDMTAHVLHAFSEISFSWSILRFTPTYSKKKLSTYIHQIRRLLPFKEVMTLCQSPIALAPVRCRAGRAR